MDIIFYNPLSKNGKTLAIVEDLIKKLGIKKEEAAIYSLLEIASIDDFLQTISGDDRLIFVGGDGTLHKLVNAIHEKKIKNRLYVYRGGTGNDFLRSLKKKKEILIDVTDYLKKLPTVIVNNKNHYFLNGVGVGIDGLISYMVNTSIEEKSSGNYFRQTIKAFLKTKKLKSVQVNIDGIDYCFKNVWFCSILNDKYMGGGMKFAPKATRNNPDLYLVTIKIIPKWLLFFLLPTIYIGIHTIFKGFIKIIRIKQSAIVKVNKDTFMQMDGEVEYPVNEIIVNTWHD